MLTLKQNHRFFNQTICTSKTWKPNYRAFQSNYTIQIGKLSVIRGTWKSTKNEGKHFLELENFNDNHSQTLNVHNLINEKEN